jgi:magnesium transporter
MSDATTGSRTAPEQTFNLSKIVGTPGIVAGQRVGEVDEFVIVDKDRYAEVTHLIVKQPFGRPPLVVPWERVSSFDREQVVLELDEAEPYAGAYPPGAILLKDYILDKKVIDGKGRELEVVYDIGMTLSGGRLLVVDVDLSKRALLRRIHLSWLARLFTASGKSLVNRVPWSYVEPLPEEMSSFRGTVRLKVLKEQLAELPPVDLADILEELGDEERMVVFGHLETEHASDTLEALDPKVQRDLIASLDKARAAVLIDEMTPAQAADVLAVLPWWEVGVILNLLADDKEKADKIKSILANQEERVIDFSSSAFLHFAPDKTVTQVRSEFRAAALRKVDITYIYVIDQGEQVVGVVDLKTLLLADEESLLRDIMTTSVVSLPPQSTLRDASEFFARYLFRVLPVIDEHGRILGVLPYRDVVALRHRFVK